MGRGVDQALGRGQGREIGVQFVVVHRGSAARTPPVAHAQRTPFFAAATLDPLAPPTIDAAATEALDPCRAVPSRPRERFTPSDGALGAERRAA